MPALLLIALLLASGIATAAVGEGTLVACGTQVGGVAQGVAPGNIFAPVSPPAREIRELSWLVLGVCLLIGVIVEAVLVWAIIKYRSRGEETGSEPTQVYGSNSVELAWTVLPCVIVFVLTLSTVRTIREVELTEPPPNALEVVCIGHQWWWEYRYPTLGITTANELVVPVGRPVWLTLDSADVIHSWWVPRLAGKTDVVPGHTNHAWFAAEEQGIFLGQCAEYCGTQHGGMFLRVDVRTETGFDAWATAQKSEPLIPAAAAPAAQDGSLSAAGGSLAAAGGSLAAQGYALFAGLACSNCHTVDGTSTGTFGPSLSHLMSRATLGSGVAPLNESNLRKWIRDPSSMKPGCNMPAMKLDDEELDAMVAYIVGLR